MEVQIEHISFAGLVVKNHLYSSVLDLHHECIYFKAQIKFIWAYVYIIDFSNIEQNYSWSICKVSKLYSNWSWVTFGSCIAAKRLIKGPMEFASTMALGSRVNYGKLGE